MRVKRKSSVVVAIALGLVAAGCSSSSTPYGDGGGDAGGAKTIVINELFPSGPDAATPDWIELKNLGAAAVDVGGFQLRDSAIADLTSLPAGTMIDAGGYLIIYCDDLADGGVAGGVHVPWKLSASKGDEVHLLDKDGTEIDVVAFPADIPGDKSWGRLPDGTGAFVRTTPTQGHSNL
jgi:Lamin Tail Domain